MLRAKKGDYSELIGVDRDAIPLRTDSHRQHRIRQTDTLEAEVLPGDTLISISLRFNCTVQDIKRINKIHNENEIFAFKVVKVPLTAQNILLDTLPKVHKSGQSSPKTSETVVSNTSTSKEKLEEKLLLASVSNAVITKSKDSADRCEAVNEVEESTDEPLLQNSRQFRGYPRTFGAPRNDYMSFDGSDCELNWVVLLIFILALCVIVPLIYVYLIYEHPENFIPIHSPYDDPDSGLKHHNYEPKNHT